MRKSSYEITLYTISLSTLLLTFLSFSIFIHAYIKQASGSTSLTSHQISSFTSLWSSYLHSMNVLVPHLSTLSPPYTAVHDYSPIMQSSLTEVQQSYRSVFSTFTEYHTDDSLLHLVYTPVRSSNHLTMLQAASYHIDSLSYLLQLSLALETNRPTVQTDIDNYLVPFETRADLLLKTGFERVLPTINYCYSELFRKVETELPKEYSTSFTIFFVIMFVLIFFNCFFYSWVESNKNDRMNKLLSVYSLLTPQDTEANFFINELKLELFQDDKFEEPELLTVYFSQTGVASKELLRDIRRRDKRVNLRTKTIFQDKVKPSVITGVLAIMFVSILQVGLILVCFSINSNISRLFKLQRIMVSHSFRLDQISNRQTHFRLFELVGDYIRMDGHLVSEDLYEEAINNFTDYWIDSRSDMKDVITVDYGIIDDMLNGDMCNYVVLPNSLDCRKWVFGSSARGIIYFLLYSDQLNYRSKSAFVSNFSQAVLDSRSSLKLTIISRPNFLNPTMMNLRLMEDNISATFYTKINEILMKNSKIYSDRTRYLLTTLTASSLILLGVSIFLSSFYIHRQTKRDWDICYETFKSLEPSTVSSNIHISSLYREYFIL